VGNLAQDPNSQNWPWSLPGIKNQWHFAFKQTPVILFEEEKRYLTLKVPLPLTCKVSSSIEAEILLRVRHLPSTEARNLILPSLYAHVRTRDGGDGIVLIGTPEFAEVSSVNSECSKPFLKPISKTLFS
jgi:hypothetical protein